MAIMIWPQYHSTYILGTRILVYADAQGSGLCTKATSNMTIEATVIGTWKDPMISDLILLGWTSNEFIPAFSYQIAAPHNVPTKWNYMKNHGNYDYVFPAKVPIEFDWYVAPPPLATAPCVNCGTMKTHSAVCSNCQPPGAIPHSVSQVVLTSQLKVTSESPLVKSVLEGPPGGCVCMKCQLINPWAAPNREGGKYLCYECTNRWWE